MPIPARLARLCLAVFLAASSGASAQIFRAYLTLDGNDANPCTLVAPCRLLPAAMAAVAAGGEIWMLDSANYNTGPVNVNKGVTILAIPGALGSVVALGGNALEINTTQAVTLRNLNILPFPGNTQHSGVAKSGAGTLVLQDSNVFGFLSGGGGTGIRVAGAATVTIARCTFRGSDFGVDAADGATVGIADTVFTGHEQYAVYATTGIGTPTTTLTITRSVVRGPIFAGGIGAHNSSPGATTRLFVTESTVEGTGGGIDVFTVDAGFAVGSVSNSLITGNDLGVLASSTAANIRLLLSGNTITGNNVGVQQAGGSIVESAGNNAIRNNTTNVSGTMTNIGGM